MAWSLSANLTIPAAAATVTASFSDTAKMWPGMLLAIEDATAIVFMEVVTVNVLSAVLVNRYYSTNPPFAHTFVSGSGTQVRLESIGNASAVTAGLVPAPPNDPTQFLRGDATFAVPPSVTSGAAGYAPASGGGTTNFLRADATWAAPAGGSGGATSTTTNGTFTIPASGSTVVVTIVAATWPIVHQKIYITDQGGGHTMFGTITAVSSSTSITVLNTGDTNNSTSGTMATAALVQLVDYQSVVWDKFTPGDNDPPATLFATFDIPTNSISTLGFVDGSTTGAVFKSVLPQYAVLGSGINVRIKWTGNDATSHAVRWGVAFERMNLAISSDHFGTQQLATGAHNATAWVINETAIAIPYSAMGSTVSGDPYRLQLQRIGADAADTFTVTAEVLMVTVESGA